MKKNLIAAQSGGPTAAINASLAGVIDGAISSNLIETVYGARYGIQGVLNEDFINLSEVFEEKEKLDHLKLTPAMALGSCRLKLPSLEKTEIYDKIYDVFKKYNIGFFVYIGGNDSMDTANKLNKYFSEKGEDIKVIGVPKTIDNDLAMTDHCPGFGSAAKFVSTVLTEIVSDALVYNVPAVVIVEIMGRNAGWLTASAALTRECTGFAPQLIYLPEVVFDLDNFIEDVKRTQTENNCVIVAVSEGAKVADGRYLSELSSDCKTDTFGHKYTSGAGKFLENLITERLGCKVRSIELNVLQRGSGHILSKDDIDSAFEIGRAAVNAACSGVSGKMMIFLRTDKEDYEYSISYCDLDMVANFEKKFPLDWIVPEGNDVTDEAIKYLKPLIKGETATPMKDGLPFHFKF